MICATCHTEYEQVEYEAVYPWLGACLCSLDARWQRSRLLARRYKVRTLGAPCSCHERADDSYFRDHAEELEIKPVVEERDVYGTCPDCGQHRELSGCGECPAPKLCLACYGLHRELKHGEKKGEQKKSGGGISL